MYRVCRMMSILKWKSRSISIPRMNLTLTISYNLNKFFSAVLTSWVSLLVLAVMIMSSTLYAQIYVVSVMAIDLDTPIYPAISKTYMYFTVWIVLFFLCWQLVETVDHFTHFTNHFTGAWNIARHLHVYSFLDLDVKICSVCVVEWGSLI